MGGATAVGAGPLCTIPALFVGIYWIILPCPGWVIITGIPWERWNGFVANTWWGGGLKAEPVVMVM